ncbi:MAG: FMN-binding negative transcriptional regulator [Alphaproteobacteria bacterium]|nr:FMN-binding negative transcriptional regulator [Alphaproteobacteria bacterium]
MHPNPTFRKTPEARNIAFARQRGFGILSINGERHPLSAHIPFLLTEDGTSLEAHLARSNPILRALKDGVKPAVLMVSGPEGYISPDWYQTDDQVPTWNYVAVHLTGGLETRPAEALLPHLDRLSGFFEARLAPKPVWLTSKVDAQVLARMQRMIVPIRMQISEIDATWKLAQNKGDAARMAAAAGLRASTPEHAALADLMENPPA